MDPEENKKSWAAILKHPMANIILGFILTGVVGTSITNYYSKKGLEEKRYQQMVSAQQKAVNKLATLNADRLARAEMMLNGLESGKGKDKIEDLIKLYKQAELQWKTESSPVMMAARQVLPEDAYYRFRDYMRVEYQERFLDPLDSCMNQLSAAAHEGQATQPILESCGARQYLNGAGRCNQALLDVFYELAQGSIDGASKQAIDEQKEKHRQRLTSACAKIDI